MAIPNRGLLPAEAVVPDWTKVSPPTGQFSGHSMKDIPLKDFCFL